MAVSSIENALDEENYEPIDYSHVSIENVAVLLEKKGKNVTKSINWTTEKPTQTVRQAPQNVIRNRPGVKREFRTAVEPTDAWRTFFDDNMVQMKSNTPISLHIKESVANSKQEISRIRHLHETNSIEVKAFVALWYFRWLLNWTFQDITVYSGKHGNSLFNTAMSIKRFRFLWANLRFDDINKREERFQHDQAGAVRALFETFTNNCEKVMIPIGYLSLDKTMYPTRVGFAFRQYNN